MTELRNSQYLFTSELADEIAKIVGIDNFSSDQYNSDTRANYTYQHRREIYEYITGKDGSEYERKELNRLIMIELDSELHAGYQHEFVREDLKIIYDYVSENPPAPKVEPEDEED